MTTSSEQKKTSQKEVAKIEDTVRDFLGPILFKSLGFEKLTRLYSEVQSSSSSENFIETMLKHMNVHVKVSPESLEAVPKTGPCVVIANHPFGGIEGLVLVQLLREIRPDVKVLANFILDQIPEIRDFFLCVDPFGTKNSVRKNVAPIRETLGWLKKDGLLAVFPAGEVSHFHLRKGQVTDPAWSKNIAGIIRRTNSCAIPIYFHGRNSLLFQLLGMVHPKLRTLMLGRELYNKKDCEIALEIGNPIPNDRLKKFASDEDMLAYLRLRTFILRYRANAPWVTSPKAKQWSMPAREPVAEPADTDRIQQEVGSLPAEQLLLENESHAVYFASANQIPIALDEIGRLRELTFREVNEGTGTARDLDRFDQTYVHLFSWNKNRKKIVGAYRLGHTDEILAREGVHGLYTHTLFRYPSELIEQMGPSLELGRSFVTKEAQKGYSSLFLLWRGIGRYVVKHPQYRNLFGPVSISAEYDAISRQLMMSYLKEHNFMPELAKYITPRKSPRPQILHGIDSDTLSTVVTDISDVSELIGEIEANEKAVPILLRQYLRLGGKLLSFNIDPHFGNVLDGLILVDLVETQPRVLRRYFGAEGYKSFMEFHGVSSPDDASNSARGGSQDAPNYNNEKPAHP